MEEIYSERYGRDLIFWDLQDEPKELISGKDTAEGIPFTAKAPERALQFLNLLFTEEGKNVWRTYIYGIPGRNYKVISEADEIVELEGMGEPEPEWSYGNQWWTIGTCEFIFTDQHASPKVYEGYIEDARHAYSHPLLGFQFDNSAVSVEEAQIAAVAGEYGEMYLKGEAGWRAMYDEYLSKLDAAGIEKYVAEVQRQVDEYVAANGCKW